MLLISHLRFRLFGEICISGFVEHLVYCISYDMMVIKVGESVISITPDCSLIIQ